jgi:hypothetical protein
LRGGLYPNLASFCHPVKAELSEVFIQIVAVVFFLMVCQILVKELNFEKLGDQGL